MFGRLAVLRAMRVNEHHDNVLGGKEGHEKGGDKFDGGREDSIHGSQKKEKGQPKITIAEESVFKSLKPTGTPVPKTFQP